MTDNGRGFGADVPEKQNSFLSSSLGPRDGGVVRSMLIGYGIAIYTLLFVREDDTAGTSAAASLALWGIAAQLVVMAARALIERLVADREIANQWLTIVELIGDGVSVLLFALSTLGAITNVASEI